MAALYAAERRKTVFLETLDQFRVDVASIAARDIALSSGDSGGFDATSGIIPDRYFTRRIVRFGVALNQRWLDVRSPETHAVLRFQLASQLDQLGAGVRFVLGDLLANHHQITRLVAQWAIDHGFHGVVYASCHDPSLTCWAIFEGVRLVRLTEPESISRSDPDLLAVAKLWNLRIPPDR